MDTKHYRKLRGDRVNWLVPSNVQGTIAGVQHAMQSKDGTITLTYTDGTKESRACDRDMVQEFDGFLPVVGYVQQGRQP